MKWVLRVAILLFSGGAVVGCIGQMVTGRQIAMPIALMAFNAFLIMFVWWGTSIDV